MPSLAQRCAQTRYHAVHKQSAREKDAHRCTHDARYIGLASASKKDDTSAWYAASPSHKCGRPDCSLLSILFTPSIYLRACLLSLNSEASSIPVLQLLDREPDVVKSESYIAKRYRKLDGKGTFSSKIVINANALGAYSLVAFDVIQDGKLSTLLAQPPPLS
eukprot:2410610-Pleurochrysis_carterae.AAC.2